MSNSYVLLGEDRLSKSEAEEGEAYLVSTAPPLPSPDPPGRGHLPPREGELASASLSCES